ncbi:MAG: trypsin-like serine protease [Pseudomonadota bacterium]
MTTMNRLFLVCLLLCGCRPGSGPIESTPFAVGVGAKAESGHAAAVLLGQKTNDNPPSSADFVQSFEGACTGTKLSTNSFVTARHCVVNGEWKVGGKITIAQKIPHHSPWTLSTRIIAVARHETLDVAVIKIADQTPAVPIAKVFGGQNPGLQTFAISGYGCTEMFVSEGQLMQGERASEMTTVSATIAGEGTFPQMEIGKFLYIKSNSKSMMGDVQVTGPALCPGDSGGRYGLKSAMN